MEPSFVHEGIEAVPGANGKPAPEHENGSDARCD